ncbi:hypothetical protein GCM10010449_29580 [Streptomyces rectiviolaceus]|uniref:Uncharacterized protein n=1 Tax=Streptomyces rectiviolaceus TaxID=332591 RepID=A0ABP6ME05_9ACTN
MTAVANPALTTITKAEVAVATRIASEPSAASAHTTTGTATNPPPKPNNTVVTPVRSPTPINITKSMGPTPPAATERPHAMVGTVPSRVSH